ncbi:MAG: isocitrate dehydrogenase [Magnetococcales bacterium]|nr:isocitrate dehydrogenase [Magnetococcales bacterium]
MTTAITVARGDGIGPEIMDASLRIMEAAGADIKPEFVTLGEEAYKAGIMTGVTDEAWESINRTKLLFKAPLTTPQGGGYKSVNVTLRKSLSLFANIRPVRTMTPYVDSKHDKFDMVVVRENEEDLYAGIEYRQTRDTCHSVKLLSRTGSEMIVRYAFEYARAYGRKKVTVLVKDNIMKISDGLFHKVFKLIAAEYPEIEAESLIVDIGMARIADTPERFDVVVTLNLYGDIVSDIVSQIAGSVGLAGSSNIGQKASMFEAVHGSAPDIAGKSIANPSGLLNAGILMLSHIGQGDVAEKIENAWLKTIEDGVHTADIAKKGTNAVSTSEFADAVIANLGGKPSTLPEAVNAGAKSVKLPSPQETTKSVRTKQLVGVDVFLDWDGQNIKELGKAVEASAVSGLVLKSISSRGMHVYPSDRDVTAVSYQWRCRFMSQGEMKNSDIRHILENIEMKGFDWIKTENLYTFDGEVCFSQSQGE